MTTSSLKFNDIVMILDNIHTFELEVGDLGIVQSVLEGPDGYVIVIVSENYLRQSLYQEHLFKIGEL